MLFDDWLEGALEAVLFIANEPLTPQRIGEVLGVTEEETRLLLERLRRSMETESRGLMVIETAGGFRLCTKSRFAALIRNVIEQVEPKLSVATLETLSIIAYKQPVTRQEIEDIRGVRVERSLAKLQEHGLIKEVGRKEIVGKPILYGTTTDFLQTFGLKNLDELPPLADFGAEVEG